MYSITPTGQNLFQEMHLNCWQHLEFNFRLATLVTNSEQVKEERDCERLPLLWWKVYSRCIISDSCAYVAGQNEIQVKMILT